MLRRTSFGWLEYRGRQKHLRCKKNPRLEFATLIARQPSMAPDVGAIAQRQRCHASCESQPISAAEKVEVSAQRRLTCTQYTVRTRTATPRVSECRGEAQRANRFGSQIRYLDAGRCISSRAAIF